MTTNRFTTSQTGTGPVLALDLTRIPIDLNVRLLRAAQQLCPFIEDCRVTAEDDDGDANSAIDEFILAMAKISLLMQPTVPGCTMFYGRLLDHYPVYRDGVEVQVPRDEMTAIEVEATLSRLRFEARAETLHADALAAAMQR